MNNSLIPMVRFGFAAGVFFFAFASEALAAPTFPVVVAESQTETTATLFAKNADTEPSISTTWFEWGTSPSSNTVVGLRQMYSSVGGTPFEIGLTDLTPNTTYYFRAVTVAGNTTLRSPTYSFTTKDVPHRVVTHTSDIINTTNIVNTTNTTNVSSAGSAMNTTALPPQRVETVVPVKEPVAARSTKASRNANAAQVVGAGDGVFPHTLIGWMELLVAVMVAVILLHMIVESNAKRKKARKEAEERLRILRESSANVG